MQTNATTRKDPITGPLPEFARPPVVEVAISVQFEPIEDLRTPQIGLLWGLFRDRYPVIEEHIPIQSKVEQFGVRITMGPTEKIELTGGAQTPRCWFLNEKGDRLVQVQKDRFIVNWRKKSDKDQYPRYSQIREDFVKELEVFRLYLDRERIGSFKPVQSELTYVNHIFTGEVWSRHAEVEKVFTLWSNRQSERFLPDPDDVRFAVRYIIPGSSGNPRGRLNVTLQPAFTKSDDRPIFSLTLIARGHPEETSIQSALGMLDVGHEWIVRGFAAITTSEMHRAWGRTNGS